MNLAYKIAQRYLISKKSTNAINLIAGVSVMGMIVGTTALLLVLSVFNGFEDLVKSLYNTFNPDIKIEAVEGKVFSPDSSQLAQLTAIEGVAALSLVLEENAFLQYSRGRDVARLKGVDDNYTKVSAIDTAIVRGSYQLKEASFNYVVLGVGVQANLGVSVKNEFAKISVFMPIRDAKINTLRPENSFKQEILYPKGAFAIQQDFDSKYAIVPLRFMRKLLNYDNEVSAIEISLKPNVNQYNTQAAIEKVMGKTFSVKNRYQQDEVLYKVMQTEKWAVYFILSFILIIASFNIIGSLSMLVIEKKKDIGILKAMGASNNFIKRIFFIEGVLLASVGASIGVALALVVCLIQQHFKVLKLEGASFLIEAYPISMRLSDFVLVFITVLVIAALAALFPALQAAKQDGLLERG